MLLRVLGRILQSSGFAWEGAGRVILVLKFDWHLHQCFWTESQCSDNILLLIAWVNDMDSYLILTIQTIKINHHYPDLTNQPAVMMATTSHDTEWHAGDWHELHAFDGIGSNLVLHVSLAWKYEIQYFWCWCINIRVMKRGPPFCVSYTCNTEQDTHMHIINQLILTIKISEVQFT